MICEFAPIEAHAHDFVAPINKFRVKFSQDEENMKGLQHFVEEYFF